MSEVMLIAQWCKLSIHARRGASRSVVPKGVGELPAVILCMNFGDMRSIIEGVWSNALEYSIQ